MVATEALNDVGIVELHRQIERHYQALCRDGRLLQCRQLQRRHDFLRILEQRLTHRLLALMEQDRELNSYVERVEKGELDACSAADEILRSQKLLGDLLRD